MLTMGVVMKDKLYNVIFPIWLLIFYPLYWLIVLPANFLIDTAVLLISLKVLKISNIKDVYKKTILKVWIIEFVADLCGAALLICTQLLPSNLVNSSIISALAYNPFSNIWSLIITFIAIIITAIIIYFMNLKLSFKKVDLDQKAKKKIAIILAVITAPYLFLYPSSLLYNNNEIDTNITEPKKIESEFSGDTITTRIFAESQNYTNTNFKYIDKIAKVDSEIINSNQGSVVNMNISTEFDESTDINEYKKWAKQCSIIVFIKQPIIDEVVVDLKNDDKESVCNLTYLKNDIENEYGVKLEDLQDDSNKLQSILDSIK